MEETPPLVKSYPPLLTKREVADLYSTSTRTIDRWLNEGWLPHESKLIVCGSTRFRTSVLLAHIAASTPETDGGEA